MVNVSSIFLADFKFKVPRNDSFGPGRWYPGAKVSRVARKTGKIHLSKADQNGVALLQDSLIVDDK